MTSVNFNVRPAAVADADAVGAMHFASWVETYVGLADAEFWDRASAVRSAAAWRNFLDQGGEATLADIDGQVVGLAAVSAASTRGDIPPVRAVELTNLYVLQEYHGTGLGQTLLEAVLPQGTGAQLWVARDNPRAVRFYERNRFAMDGAENDGAAFGGIPALRMIR